MPQLDSSIVLTDEQVRIALRNWHGKDLTRAPFATLYLFRKLSRETERPAHYVTNMLLLQALDDMEGLYQTAVAFLKRRFWDERSIAQLAIEFSIAESTVYIHQNDAITKLRETILYFEQRARREHRAVLDLRLGPRSNVNLVGIEGHIRTLAAQLHTTDGPGIIALEGLGGIGKTSLARAIVDELLDEQAFDEIGWVSARHEQLEHGGALKPVDEPVLTADGLLAALARQLIPELTLTAEQQSTALTAALHTRLKQVPHLIVIDNLETVVDLEALLPSIQTLADPTKFLLTSRTGLHTSPNVYHFGVPELNEVAALALLRQEIAGSHLTALEDWPDEALLPIYTVVGGNPLALRLVIAQAHFSFSTICAMPPAAWRRTSTPISICMRGNGWMTLPKISFW